MRVYTTVQNHCMSKIKLLLHCEASASAEEASTSGWCHTQQIRSCSFRESNLWIGLWILEFGLQISEHSAKTTGPQIRSGTSLSSWPQRWVLDSSDPATRIFCTYLYIAVDCGFLETRECSLIEKCQKKYRNTGHGSFGDSQEEVRSPAYMCCLQGVRMQKSPAALLRSLWKQDLSQQP